VFSKAIGVGGGGTDTIGVGGGTDGGGMREAGDGVVGGLRWRAR